MMGKPIKVKGVKRLRNKELIPFTRQLASMLNAGMTILASIQTLGEQSSDPEFKKVLQHLCDVIESGAPLSNGLADYPQLFDDMYVNMVIAGEQSGEFANIMKRLANILQSSSRLRKKVKSAMTYPTVIVSIALLLAAGLIQFVVPVFAEMFSGFGKKLPWLTQTLVDRLHFLIRHLLTIIFAKFQRITNQDMRHSKPTWTFINYHRNNRRLCLNRQYSRAMVKRQHIFLRLIPSPFRENTNFFAVF
jgi:type IV pilus assembly protein PilC